MPYYRYDYNALDENGEFGAYVLDEERNRITEEVNKMVYNATHFAPESSAPIPALEALLNAIAGGASDEEAAEIAKEIDK